MFKKYGHFRQREFKGNWTSEIKLDSGYKIKFIQGKIYLPVEVEDVRITITNKELAKVAKFVLAKKPDLIADYVRKHFFRSIFYTIESCMERKNGRENT